MYIYIYIYMWALYICIYVYRKKRSLKVMMWNIKSCKIGRPGVNRVCSVIKKKRKKERKNEERDKSTPSYSLKGGSSIGQLLLCPERGTFGLL